MDVMRLHEMHARHLKALRRSPETIRFYRQAAADLSRFLEAEGRSQDAREIMRADLVLCQEAMIKRGLKDGAIAAMMRGLRGMFRWAKEEELLARNPTERLPVPSAVTERPPAIQPEEVLACLRAVKGMPSPLRNTAILTLMYDCGARLGEIVGMRLEDVDLARGVVTVRADTSKVARTRVVPLGIRSARALGRYERLERRPLIPHVGELFLAKGGAPLTKSGLSQLLNRISRAAELPRDHVAPHAWRRGFAVEYLRNGGDMFSLQQILGHTTLELTRRYVAYLPADLQRQHLRASPSDHLGRARL